MKEIKILLVNPTQGLSVDEPLTPKFKVQNLGLLYVAAVLEKHNYHVEILDSYNLGSNLEEIGRAIPRFDVLGITAATILANDAYRVAEEAKKVNPEILTVLGGCHASVLPDEPLQRNIDVVVMGEGEYTMLELCEQLSRGNREFEGIPGIAFRKDDTTVRNALRPPIENLDDIPFPAHHLLLPIKQYNPFPHWGKPGSFAPIITSRGCPYSCLYCSITRIQGRRYRFRSAENVLDELEWLNKHYDVSTFSFRDGTFTLKKDRVAKICEMIISRKLNIAWNCNGRVNEVDEALLKLMKEAGCKGIQYGIEVGDPERLRAVKRLTPEQVERSIHNTDKAGIAAHGYFMFGLPGETPETIEKTIEFAKSLELDSAGFTVAVPFPGTEFWDYISENNLIQTFDWNKYSTQSTPVFDHETVTHEQLLKAQKRAYREFYLRPKVMWRHTKKLRSVSTLRNYLRKMLVNF